MVLGVCTVLVSIQLRIKDLLPSCMQSFDGCLRVTFACALVELNNWFCSSIPWYWVYVPCW